MIEKDESHELLVLWMNLDRALADLKRASNLNPRSKILPWSCDDVAVKAAWIKVTDPKNLSALEYWLQAASENEHEEGCVTTQKAIDECKRRLREERNAK